MKKVNGYGETEVEGETRTIPADATGDALTVFWPNLPTIEDGMPVTYLVKEDPVEGYTTNYAGGVYNSDGTELTITVTNTLKEPEPEPEPETRIYLNFVDYKNDPEAQVVRLLQITPEEYAATQETYNTYKPANPSHSGVTFQQWDHNVNQTEQGDILVTYVAQYQTPPPAKQIVVSYVDGQDPNGDVLKKSEVTTDPSSVTAPADPAHEGCKFVSWTQTIDAGGNYIYVAKFVPDCEPCPPTPDDGGSNPPAPPTPDRTPTRPVPFTGDMEWMGYALTGWMALLLLGGVMIRRKRQR